MTEYRMTYWIELEDKNGDAKEGFGLGYDGLEFTPPARVSLDNRVYGYVENDQEVLFYREIT